MLFGKKKTIGESDPAELGIEALLVLQRSLMAKLILTNDELLKRWRGAAAASGELPNAKELHETFLSDEKFLRGCNILLKEALARLLGKI
jgi:hypothetical protein